MTANDLDARYGRTPARRTRLRVVAVLAAIAVALVVGAWVIWAGLFAPTASLEAKDLGFAELSSSSVEVRWQLTAPPGSEVSCAVKAISDKHAVIGWRVIEVEPSELPTRNVAATLRTSEPPNGGLIYRCWLT